MLEHHVDWPELRLAFSLTPSREFSEYTHVVFDMHGKLQLSRGLPEGFDSQPEWPAFEDVMGEKEIWRDYPHISPPLRRYLRGLPEDEAHAQYARIALGETDACYVARGKDDTPKPPLPWPTGDDLRFETALEAAAAYGEPTLFPILERTENKDLQQRKKSARRRIRRALAKLDQEQARLEQFRQDRIKAEAMQAELYRLQDIGDAESVELNHPEHGAVIVELNPHLTPSENMERYFKLAGKADRGFPHVEARRKMLLDEMERVESEHLPEREQSTEKPKQVARLPKRYKGLAVHVFVTNDGFTVVRGKNKKANHDIISKAASTFDYWFHVADGPSSHVILRRDHPGQEVPETSLRQAATLCANKSWRKDDSRADVMYALVKDVRKVKGFAHGQVVVDDTVGVVRTEPDSNIEKQLRKEV
ncbi:NFACT RNA binding domain-containing protein [Salidesulfovibrio brasiliensis]